MYILQRDPPELGKRQPLRIHPPPQGRFFHSRAQYYQEMNDMSGSRGEANFVWKCKMCKVCVFPPDAVMPWVYKVWMDNLKKFNQIKTEREKRKENCVFLLLLIFVKIKKQNRGNHLLLLKPHRQPTCIPRRQRDRM